MKQGGIAFAHDVRTTSSDSLQAWVADARPWIELHCAVPGESSGRHLLAPVDRMAEAFSPAAVATCQVGCTYAHEAVALVDLLTLCTSQPIRCFQGPVCTRTCASPICWLCPVLPGTFISTHCKGRQVWSQWLEAELGGALGLVVCNAVHRDCVCRSGFLLDVFKTSNLWNLDCMATAFCGLQRKYA